MILRIYEQLNRYMKKGSKMAALNMQSFKWEKLFNHNYFMI